MLRDGNEAFYLEASRKGCFTICSYWKKAIPLEELLAVNNKAEEIAWKLQADAGALSLQCSLPTLPACSTQCIVMFLRNYTPATIRMQPHRNFPDEARGLRALLTASNDHNMQASTWWVWMELCTTRSWTPSSTWALPLPDSP